MCIFTLFRDFFLIPTLSMQYSLRTRLNNLFCKLLQVCIWSFILGLGTSLFGYFEYPSESFASFMFSYLFFLDSFCSFLYPEGYQSSEGVSFLFLRQLFLTSVRVEAID